MGTFLGILVVLGISAYISYLINDKYEESDSEFKQKGVTVNYENSTVELKRKTFTIGQVKNVWQEGRAVCFEVDDIADPIKKIKFGEVKHAATFLARIKIALDTAYNNSLG